MAQFAAKTLANYLWNQDKDKKITAAVRISKQLIFKLQKDFKMFFYDFQGSFYLFMQSTN